MGRKKQYSDHAERSRAYRQRKQKQPSKLSNVEKLEIAKMELSKLKNPSRNDLIYTLMVNQDWNRTLATETVNMLELNEKIEFTEKTEQPKPESEFEEIKQALSIIGKFTDKEVRWIMTFSDTYKEELKQIYKQHMNRIQCQKEEKKCQECEDMELCGIVK